MTRGGLTTVFLVAAIVASTPVAAQTPVSASEAARAADDNEVVCKKQTDTGSRFQKKTCRTRAQWEQMRIQQQRDLREHIDRPLVNGARGG